MSYQSMEEAKLRGEKENIPFWKAIQLEDAQERDVKIEDSWEKMKYMWQSMLDALDAYEPDKVSRSGLVGTEGGLMDNYRENEEPLCGDFVSKVMSNALKMGCNNACMKRIVAAPTAVEKAEAVIKPGVRFCDIDAQARDLIDEAGYSEYWRIRLGHFIGQEDHEYGDVSPINKNVAEPGMIFSIEPGIYLEGKYGVRVEDLVLVTEDGH